MTSTNDENRPGPTGRMEVPPGVPARLRDYMGEDQYEYGELAPLRMMGRAAFEAMLARPEYDDLPDRVRRRLLDFDWEAEAAWERDMKRRVAEERSGKGE